jgi:hypothetical protein
MRFGIGSIAKRLDRFLLGFFDRLHSGVSAVSLVRIQALMSALAEQPARMVRD